MLNMNEFTDLSRPKVEKRPWMEKVHMELVTSTDRLREVVDECIAAGVYAWDIETTGLDNRVFPGPDEGRTVDSIVGHCLAPTKDRGFYVPVRHVAADGSLLPVNVPLSEANAELRRLAESEAVAVFHHSKFDQEFLEWGEDAPIGSWDDPDHWDDTFILAYLRDTRDKIRGLKPLSANELGREMIELEDLFTKEEQKRLGGRLNFSILDPSWEPCVWYACSDAMNTRGLRDVLLPVIVDQKPRSQKVVYRLEKMCLPATRWMERCRINIDRSKVRELISLGQAEWLESLEEVYDTVSKHLGRNIRPGWFRLMQGEPGLPPTAKFNPSEMDPSYMECREEAMRLATQLQLDPMTPDSKGNSRVNTICKEVPSVVNKKKKEVVDFPLVYDVTIPAELGLLLREIGVSNLRTTEKSGQVKTSKDELDRVIEESGDDFPFMAKIKRFRETAKALGTNLFPLWNDTIPERSRDGTIHVGFNAHKVETGRFSTPQPRDKVFHGQVRWNLHSIPASYDKNKPACMLRIRECVSARPGKLLFAIDYSGVELRIVTNESREPKWIEEFFRCSNCEHTFDRGNGKETPEAPPPFCPECGSDKIGDLHSLTAIAVYGEEIKGTKEFKGKRQKAKGLNFAMCYGGGPAAAQRSVGVDRDEGFRIKRQFDATYIGLRQWWSAQHNFARMHKHVTTAFGRKYPLPDIDHENGHFRSKAERNAVNGPVQGTSADIMKLAMALIYKEVKKRGWLSKVLMTITIHDELVFEIDEDIAEEAILMIVPLMTRKTVEKLRRPIPLKVDIEFGRDWSVPYDLTNLTWNKSDKWNTELARIFPKSYQEYLARGGRVVEGHEAVEPAAQVSQPERAVPTKPGISLPETGMDKPYVHTVGKDKLTAETLYKLAELIHKCEGRGTQVLILQTEDGEPLWEGPEIRVSAVQFKILAEEYEV